MANYRIGNYVTLTIIMLIAVVNSETLKLNTEGFQRCTFNLVSTQDSQRRMSTADFVGCFVASNQGSQLWTILARSSKNDNDSVLLTSRYLKEVCSINIIVSIEGCSSVDLIFVFGSRLYNPNSMLYIIDNLYTFKSECQGRGKPRPLSFSNRRVNLDVVSLYLTKDNLNVDMSVLWCTTCWPKDYRFVELTVPYYNLSKIRRFSDYIKRLSAATAVALIKTPMSTNISSESVRNCQYLYTIRWSTQPQRIGCVPLHILIENIAAKLNYSVDYITTGKREDLDFFIFTEYRFSKQYAAIALLGIVDWLRWYDNIPSENLFRQVLRETRYSSFFYCSKTEERERFSFWFWTVPFDTWSWVWLILTVLAITVILRGEWFPVFAVLMRQDCTILNGRQKVIIVFILATIIFTYGYEGVISSFLTVKPPVFVYETLKDLLDKGYRISKPNGSNFTPYKFLFERENITGSIESRISWLPWNTTNLGDYAALAECNVTSNIADDDRRACRVAMNGFMDFANTQLYCHLRKLC